MRYWTFSDYSHIVSTNREILQRVYYALALFTLLLNACYQLMISQIGPNPLLNQDVDPVYLAFMAAGIPRFLSGWPAPYFDALLIASCVASLVWTKQRISPLLFFVLYFTYFVCYNMLSGHHYTNVGLLVMSLPFIFSSNLHFTTAFSVCRFLFCFMMFSAACWKILRGNLWHVDQASVLLITTHLETLLNPGAAGNSLLSWLIGHKTATHLIWVILILLEFIFILGFIALRWDKLLLASYLLFFTGGWIIFRIYNFENLILLLTLAPVLRIIVRAERLLKARLSDSPSLRSDSR
jgi:hypothetical protein